MTSNSILITYNQEQDKPIDFNFYAVPTSMISHLIHGLTYELLARSGVHFESTDLEKRFGIRIDYFRAVRQCLDAGKVVIESDFSKERQKNWLQYQSHCKTNGIEPKQIFIDFPVSSI